MLRTTRDPDAMDIDTMCKPEKLLKEQEDWLTKKLCFQCGKHPFETGVRCCNPVYKRYYKLPETGKDMKSPPTTRVQTLDEDHKTEDQDRMEFLANALKEFDGKEKGKANEQETTVCIIEVNEQDFLQWM